MLLGNTFSLLEDTVVLLFLDSAASGCNAWTNFSQLSSRLRVEVTPHVTEERTRGSGPPVASPSGLPMLCDTTLHFNWVPATSN